MYFLGFAGYGEERVFAEEIKLADAACRREYGPSSRSVLLLNDRRDLTTCRCLGVVTALLARRDRRVMNRDEDVLFLALSSHGSRTRPSTYRRTAWSRSRSAPRTLADAAGESGIRWKVIVVSACFSGAFIEPLADDHTIVITAASKNRTSFGCSDSATSPTSVRRSIVMHCRAPRNLRAAFEAAQQGNPPSARRRKACKASQPQGYFGPLMEEKLRGIERRVRCCRCVRNSRGAAPGRSSEVGTIGYRAPRKLA